MQQLQGFEIISQNNPQKVCLLLKSIYDLNQSEWIWDQTFHKFLMKFDLEAIEADPCVYILKLEPRLIVTLVVDDSLATCSSTTWLEDFVHHMKQHFGITRSNVDLNIGLHILCLQENGHIFIHQAIYLQQILSRFGFNE